MLWNAKNGNVLIDNTKMSYVSFGYGEKILILLPGLSDGLTAVKGKAILLAWQYRLFFEKCTVYIFSRKNNLPDDYSIRDRANDQAKVMQKLGIKKAVVMGVSQGGMIVQYLAIDNIELIEKLIIAVYAPRTNELIESCVNRWIELANHGMHKELIIETTEKSYSQKYLRKYRRIYPILGALTRPADYRRFLINANAILEFNALKELGNISCPTLIIGGSDDSVVGIEGSYEMHERILNSELFVYQGLWHSAYEEGKDFNKQIFDF